MSILNQTQAEDTMGLKMLRIIATLIILFPAFIFAPVFWLLGVRHYRTHISNAANSIVENDLPPKTEKQ